MGNNLRREPMALVADGFAHAAALTPQAPDQRLPWHRRWLTTNRRLAKDYERLVETGKMLLYLAMSRILLRRLTRKER
jgi:hypothetical protein